MAKKRISFSTVEFSDLQEVVDLTETTDDTRFHEWFQFNYSLHANDTTFLDNLISRYRLLINSFSEEELKAYIIIPLINRVDFFQGTFRDWYERPLKATIHGVLFHGFTDFMVAKGLEKPQKPYFFIQEFRRMKGREIDPKNQLLAELLVGITLNNTKVSRGAFVIGPLWNFVILDKIEQKYVCSISKNFDSMKLEDLQQIYINLHAVKHLYCKE